MQKSTHFSMKRKSLIQLCMGCTNLLWHVRSLKSKSSIKQNTALVLVILHYTLTIIYGIIQLVEYILESHPSVQNGSYIVPLAIREYVYWTCIPSTLVALCRTLTKVPKIVKRFHLIMDASDKTLCSTRDLVTFALIVLNSLTSLAGIVRVLTECSSIYLGRKLLLLIAMFLTFTIELNSKIFPVIISIYCNFFSEFIYDAVDQLSTSLKRPSASIERTNKYSDPVGLVHNEKLLTQLGPNQFSSFVRLTLNHLSDYLKNLYSISAWIIFFTMIRSTTELTSLIFGVLYVKSMGNIFYFCTIITEKFFILLLVLDISERLVDKVR